MPGSWWQGRGHENRNHTLIIHTCYLLHSTRLLWMCHNFSFPFETKDVPVFTSSKILKISSVLFCVCLWSSPCHVLPVSLGICSNARQHFTASLVWSSTCLFLPLLHQCFAVVAERQPLLCLLRAWVRCWHYCESRPKAVGGLAYSQVQLSHIATQHFHQQRSHQRTTKCSLKEITQYPPYNVLTWGGVSVVAIAEYMQPIGRRGGDVWPSLGLYLHSLLLPSRCPEPTSPDLQPWRSLSSSKNDSDLTNRSQSPQRSGASGFTSHSACLCAPAHHPDFSLSVHNHVS